MTNPSFRYNPPFAAGINVNGQMSLMPANFSDNTQVRFYFDPSGNICVAPIGATVQQGSGSPTITKPSAFGNALYLDVSSGILWLWNGDVWAVIGNINGAQGPAGAGLTNGPGSAYSVTEDLATKGPNPWVDVRLYGARPVGINSVPGASTTITTTASSATATLSAASSWQNGDGITIPGAGATPSITTPSSAFTAAASLAAAGTGTGLVVNAPSGSTSYQYQIVARDIYGGLTAASTAVSISNGAASLGHQSVNITSLSRTNNIVTVTTASAHGLAVGGLVWIYGTSDDANFGGWFNVASSADNTHFVYNTNIDARLFTNGVGVSATGGAVVYFNCNHIQITPVAGVWQYYIYGRVSGSMTLLGATPPVNSDLAGDATYLTWDDFGSTMSVPPALPSYVPSTPPSSATNQNLTTTISSGAGTTTLTLATTASASVSVAPLFDCGPGLVAAATKAMSFSGGGGMVVLPAPTNTPGNVQIYLINSYTKLPVGVGVAQAGNVFLNDTLIIGGVNWRGDFITNGTAMNFSQFAFMANTQIYVNSAYPGIYSQAQGTITSGINVGSLAANALLWVQDGLSPTMLNSAFTVSGYMGMCYLMRFAYTNQSFGAFFKKNLFLSSQLGGGMTATPAVMFNYAAFVDMDNTFLSGAGILARLYGSTFKAHWTYRQGGTHPMFTFVDSSADVELDTIESDTDAQAVVAFLGVGGTNGGNVNLRVRAANGPSSGQAFITGLPVVGAIQLRNAGTPGIYGANLNIDSVSEFYSLSLPNYGGYQAGNTHTMSILNRPLLFQGNPSHNAIWALPSPTSVGAVVSSGGSVPVQAWTYEVTAVGYDGGESAVGSASSVSTTSGNQTVTVSWTASPGAQFYNVYRNGSRCVSGTHATSPFVDTASYTTGANAPSIESSGIVSIGYDSNGNPTVISPRVQLIPTTPPTSTSGGGTVGTLGQIIAGTDGNLYFCSLSGAAGSAHWNKLNLTAV